MPRASETREKEKISCPCGKTISIDGALKCRGCGRIYCLEELMMQRLFNGATTWQESMEVFAGAARHYDPDREAFTRDTPFHARVREMFGARFLGIPEFRAIFPQKHSNVQRNAELFIPLLSIPYRFETLKEASRSASAWLVLIGFQHSIGRNIDEYGYSRFCTCHANELNESRLRDLHTIPGWRLIQFENSGRTYFDRTDCDIAEAVYFALLSQAAAPSLFRSGISYGCHSEEFAFTRVSPSLRVCPTSPKLYVASRDYYSLASRNNLVHMTVHRPDILS